MAARGILQCYTDKAIEKKISRERAKEDDTIEIIKAFLFQNTEVNKRDGQSWFIFRHNLFEEGIENPTAEDIAVGLGRASSNQNETSFHKENFVIGTI